MKIPGKIQSMLSRKIIRLLTQYTARIHKNPAQAISKDCSEK